MPPLASHAPSEQRVFNDDLLTNPGDLRYAKEQFPGIFPLLDNPELRSAFATYEARANKAKSWVRRLGLLALFFGTAALLSAATEPLWAHAAMAKSYVITFEICGLVAALIAGGGVWLGPWKKRWLQNRFMSERLRQWHFQLLLSRANAIETAFESGGTPAWQKFRLKRKTWLNDFLHDYKAKLDSRMGVLAHDPDAAAEWLHDQSQAFKENSAALSALFDAFRQLRILHQYDYVTHKLLPAKDSSFFDFPAWCLRRQDSFLGGAVSSCFGAALLCACAVIVNRFLELRPALDPVLACLTLVIAICGIALRTIHDALGVPADIERYLDYRGQVRRVLFRFDAARDQQTKLRLLQELELAAVDELRGFLRTHSAARFLL